MGERKIAPRRGLSIHVAHQSRRFSAPMICAVRCNKVRSGHKKFQQKLIVQDDGVIPEAVGVAVT
jgi:hypothetical protein